MPKPEFGGIATDAVAIMPAALGAADVGCGICFHTLVIAGRRERVMAS